MKTILLLDDESVVMKLLRIVLKEYKLIEATTAEQALRFFIDNDRRVDLLLADLTLPVGSGLQVALLLRSEIPKLPVILTSGYPANHWSDRDSAELARLGPDSVTIVQKPFAPDLILNSVRDLIGVPQSEQVRTA